MEFDLALGKAVKEVRLSKALRQEFFSDISSTSHISRLESGQKGATVTFVNKIAEAMNVHPLTVLTLAYLNNDEKINFQELIIQVQKELFQINKAITTNID